MVRKQPMAKNKSKQTDIPQKALSGARNTPPKSSLNTASKKIKKSGVTKTKQAAQKAASKKKSTKRQDVEPCLTSNAE